MSSPTGLGISMEFTNRVAHVIQCHQEYLFSYTEADAVTDKRTQGFCSD